MAELTYSEVAALLQYDPETGKLFWKARTPDMVKPGNQTSEVNCRVWNGRWAGKEAFTCTMNNGYRQGNVNNTLYLAHRIIWLLCHGEWPTDQIDHINGERSDNRIANLRVVTCAENLRNMGLRPSNKSGVHGVSWENYTNKWKVQIKVDGKNKNLGRFSDILEAEDVRKAADVQYGYHVNNGKVRSRNGIKDKGAKKQE